MARVKRGVTSHAKHKKVFKATKGHYGRRRNTIRHKGTCGRVAVVLVLMVLVFVAGVMQ